MGVALAWARFTNISWLINVGEVGKVVCNKTHLVYFYKLTGGESQNWLLKEQYDLAGTTL